MRILYIDIDSLRPDHLGCYGYHRDTSPNIDSIAADGVRLDQVYVSDTPCLPSRTSLWGGRFGIHNGVNGHGGTAADPFIEGRRRGFQSEASGKSWMAALRRCGYHTATVSSFGERHSALHWYAGFNEICNPGYFGMERADQVAPLALDWLQRHGKEDKWFLHVNFWDPHVPYRTPPDFPNIFADKPIPSWITEDVRQSHWQGGGPHSAREVNGFQGGSGGYSQYPLQPTEIDSMDKVRAIFDGYDLGIRYADEYIGRLFQLLTEIGVMEDTAIIISADHGDDLGELNIYGDHLIADEYIPHVPLIIRWPGVTSPNTVDKAFHYHFDLAASVVELAGGEIPDNWDAKSFAANLKGNAKDGRPYLVLTHGAWSCQRAVRWKDTICIRTYHDGYNGFPDVMLFDLFADPHEQHDLAADHPELVAEASSYLEDWTASMLRSSTHAVDPLWTIMREGGPFHTRGALAGYLKRLKETGRSEFAERVARNHPGEATELDA